MFNVGEQVVCLFQSDLGERIQHKQFEIIIVDLKKSLRRADHLNLIQRYRQYISLMRESFKCHKVIKISLMLYNHLATLNRLPLNSGLVLLS